MGIKGRFFLERVSRQSTVENLRYVNITEEEMNILYFLRFFVLAYPLHKKLIVERKTKGLKEISPLKTAEEIINHLDEVYWHQYALEEREIKYSLTTLKRKGLIKEQEQGYMITARGVLAIVMETEQVETEQVETEQES